MNEKNDYLEDEEIDLVVLICDMLKGLRKMWLPFLIICILGTISGILYPIFRYTYIPSYRSQAIFSISTSNLYDETNTSYGFYYDAGTASQLENLLPYVLSSDIMQQKLKEELNTETVNGNIRISGVAKSNLFTMEVVSGDAAEAKRILDAALECLPQVSRYVIGETKLNIIEPSNLPVEPIAKRFQRSNPVKGLFLGIGVCIVILLAYAVFRKTIRKENDFRECLNISCLGVIPQVKFKAHRKKIDRRISVLNDKTGQMFVESIRSLSLKITRKTDTDDKKILLITSTLPGEGKSTIAMNLALSLKEDGKKVLLIDMDLRNPTLWKLLNVSPNDARLENVLRAKCKLSEGLIKHESGIYFLGTHKKCSNIQALITKPAFASILKVCREEMDYIIIDTPPCSAIGDAASISDFCDGICYVIRQDAAKRWQILDGIQQITSHGKEIYGGVLNGAESRFSGYGYGYGQYGRYGKYGKYGKYGNYGQYGYGSYGRKKEKDL